MPRLLQEDTIEGQQGIPLERTGAANVLPRIQSGGSPQHLLVTLLGDYWYTREEMLPAAAIKLLLADFGISSTGSRTTLSRLTKRGSLITERRGRNSYFALSADARARMEAGFVRIAKFGSGTPQWDGNWTVATFTTPDSQREQRNALRYKLRWLGFAPLFDGVWISPNADQHDTRVAFEELSITSFAVFYHAASLAGIGLTTPWDTETLRTEYLDFISETEVLVERIEKGEVGASQALIERTKLMDTWRSFPSKDPDLPYELLPESWPRHRARELFVRAYEGLGPLARLRVMDAVALHQSEIADLVQCRSLFDVN